MGCRVLQKNDKKITFAFKGEAHKGIDLVGPGATLDYIVAHSDGTVAGVVSNINYNTSKMGQRIYGNYVKIKHDNGMYTLYAHMQYGSVKVSNGQRVTKGQVIGYMGNTGYAFGAHLHFEVRNTEDKYIDPTPYIDADLPQAEKPQEPTNLPYEKGDKVRVKQGSVDYDGASLASFVYNNIYDVIQASGNRIVIGIGNQVTCAINKDNLIKVNNNSETKIEKIEEGNKVRVKQGATDYDGTALAPFVYQNEYDVIQLSGDRAVIGIGNAVTAAINVSNLYK